MWCRKEVQAYTSYYIDLRKHLCLVQIPAKTKKNLNHFHMFFNENNNNYVKQIIPYNAIAASVRIIAIRYIFQNHSTLIKLKIKSKNITAK